MASSEVSFDKINNVLTQGLDTAPLWQILQTAATLFSSSNAA
jgi:hypothetical protein